MKKYMEHVKTLKRRLKKKHFDEWRVSGEPLSEAAFYYAKAIEAALRRAFIQGYRAGWTDHAERPRDVRRERRAAPGYLLGREEGYKAGYKARKDEEVHR